MRMLKDNSASTIIHSVIASTLRGKCRVWTSGRLPCSLWSSSCPAWRQSEGWGSCRTGRPHRRQWGRRWRRLCHFCPLWVIRFRFWDRGSRRRLAFLFRGWSRSGKRSPLSLRFRRPASRAEVWFCRRQPQFSWPCLSRIYYWI